LFAVTALAQTGDLTRAAVATYLIHHAGWPERWTWRTQLEPPAGLPVAGWGSLALTPREIRAKTTAIERYRTQTAVMGSRLRSFDASNEIFARLTPSLLGSGSRAGTGARPGARERVKLLCDGETFRATLRVPRQERAAGACRAYIRVVGAERTRRWEF